MNVDKTLSPFSNFLKKNNKVINLLLIILLVLMLFPIDHFFNSNPVKEFETTVGTLISNPMTMAVLTLLTYVVYISNDTMMFTLYMFVLHRLTMHAGASPSAPPARPTPPPARPTPPPPAPKKVPPTPKKAPPPPAPKKVPPTPKKAPPPPAPPVVEPYAPAANKKP